MTRPVSLNFLTYSKDPRVLNLSRQLAQDFSANLNEAATPELLIQAWKSQKMNLILLCCESIGDFNLLELNIKKEVGYYSDAFDANSIFIFLPFGLSEAEQVLTSPISGACFQLEGTESNECRLIVLQAAKLALSERQASVDIIYNSDQLLTYSLKHSNDKPFILSRVEEALMKFGFKSRQANLIVTAADELIMNAVFDAPVDELGNQIYSKTSRDTPMELTGKNSVLLKIGYDNNLLALSVCDQHGSLNHKSLNKYIVSSYKKSNYEVKETQASAGIGLANIYQLGATLIFISEAQARTEVIALFSNIQNYGKFKKQYHAFAPLFYF